MHHKSFESAGYGREPDQTEEVEERETPAMTVDSPALQEALMHAARARHYGEGISADQEAENAAGFDWVRDGYAEVWNRYLAAHPHEATVDPDDHDAVAALLDRMLASRADPSLH
jgi:hypothetical protein